MLWSYITRYISGWWSFTYTWWFWQRVLNGTSLCSASRCSLWSRCRRCCIKDHAINCRHLTNSLNLYYLSGNSTGLELYYLSGSTGLELYYLAGSTGLELYYFSGSTGLELYYLSGNSTGIDLYYLAGNSTGLELYYLYGSTGLELYYLSDSTGLELYYLAVNYFVIGYPPQCG